MSLNTPIFRISCRDRLLDVHLSSDWATRQPWTFKKGKVGYVSGPFEDSAGCIKVKCWFVGPFCVAKTTLNEESQTAAKSYWDKYRSHSEPEWDALDFYHKFRLLYLGYPDRTM